jgi:hypothetical protein
MGNASLAGLALDADDLRSRFSSSPAVATTATHPTPINVLRLRAWARAKLVAVGMFDMLEAVDGLQQFAESSGLVEEIGQDAVQDILAHEFEALR